MKRLISQNSFKKSLVKLCGIAFTLAGFSNVHAATGDAVLINEVLGSTTGTDVEYIELFGAPGESLDGLSLIVVESDDQASNGNIDKQYDFMPGDAIGDNGFFLVGNGLVANTYGVEPNQSIANNFVENSSYTLALVEAASIKGNVVSGSEVVLDAVGVWDGDIGDSFYFNAPIVGPDGPFLPAGVRRIADGVDTDTATDWLFGDFNNGSDNTPTAGIGDSAVGPEDCFDQDVDLIGQVQGSGFDAFCEDKLVSVRGIVTRVAVDLLDGPGVETSLDGFFIQDAGDGDAATSDGIFIYLDGLTDNERDDYAEVAVGDQVFVEGVVSEFFGLTEITADSISIESQANALPLPAVIDLVELNGELEPYESMLVQTGDLFAANNFDFDRFGEIEAYPFLAFQPTELNDPGSADYFAEVDLLDAGRIIVDDLRSGSFNQPVPFFVSDAGVDRVVRWGDSIPAGQGIIGFGFGQYRFYPLGNPIVAGDTFQPTNARPTAAPEVGGTLQLASLNALNFWTNDGGQERGARSQNQFDIQAAKLVQAIIQLDADVLALQELQNDPEGDRLGNGVSSDGEPADDFALLNLDGTAKESAQVLAELVNNVLGYQRYTFIDTGVIGSDAIKVGFLYDQTTVKPVGKYRIVDDSVDPAYDDDRNRPSLVQVFKERASKQKFTAVSVHFKSKGSSDLRDLCPDIAAVEAVGEDPRNCDQGDGAGFWNQSRTQAAEVLRNYLDRKKKRRGLNPKVAVLGDFNAYTREDPVQVFENAGWFNLDQLSSEVPASFVFNGLAGNLDHAFVNRKMARKIIDAELYDINGTESFETTYFGPLVEFGSEFRSSDHSPLLIGVDLDDERDDDDDDDDDERDDDDDDDDDD